MNDVFSDKELMEARKQLCFNLVSHYDRDISRKNPEKAIIRMSLEDGIPSWLLNYVIETFFEEKFSQDSESSIDYFYGKEQEKSDRVL